MASGLISPEISLSNLPEAAAHAAAFYFAFAPARGKKSQPGGWLFLAYLRKFS
ncbi:hypothetical protein [Anaerotruncus massiliensis (ex Liu et al. 2021)]|uniref:hypothetical protein n=1 Tax=Anaerotruncus massiliensis (ex Liu et al. 2021) TaxID=2321404 RepID=UPI0013141B4B|nr:hypothetical protein [Anaerotruncus massiliensis (ex Liu et al. 2021)]